MHYGIKRKSGRYPWGSGENPQRSLDILSKVDALKEKGLSEKDRAATLGMSINKLRSEVSYANEERQQCMYDRINSRIEDGMSPTEIGRALDMPESTVRKYRDMPNPKDRVKNQQLSSIEETLRQQVKEKGYLDVGPGVEQQLGITRSKLDAVVKKLESEEGLYVHKIYVPQVAGGDGKYTTVKTLSAEKDKAVVQLNKDKIRPPETWSDDGGLTFQGLGKIESIGKSKVKIVYGDEGGSERDGLMELRRGADGLDMGRNKYAQVRIGVDDTHYLKGMAIYGDKMPAGKDIVFYTNKPKGTPFEKVLKEMKDNADNPFGATIKRQNGKVNIVNEEGDWAGWKSTFSSQFLSKQPFNLIKERVNITIDKKKKGLDEIMALTNPVVKKKLLNEYADELDTAASSLKLQAFPKTKSNVLLPFPSIKPNEVYAPNFKDGDRVALVRHPHGGKFEIPELTVNNKGIVRKILGNTQDAIGIHPSVAGKLSGADFDGDSVLVIPNNHGKVKSSKSLAGLKDFDPNIYKVDRKTIGSQQKQTQMGVVSNLITDMTLKGASTSELARAVRHSMVVIDAEKHNLDWKKSAADNGIGALQKRYQAHTAKVEFDKFSGKMLPGKEHRGGASTIISRSSKEFKIFNPETGKKKESTNLMNLVDDAYKLSSGTAKENEYARYANTMKAMAKTARAQANSIKKPKANPSAALKYKDEVASLNVKLNKALANAPRERQAQLLANKVYAEKVRTQDLDKDQKKKTKTQALSAARQKVGAERYEIELTDREWKAVQSHAISPTKLEAILNHSNADRIRELATPRTNASVNSGSKSRVLGLLANGYTNAEVAEHLGISASMVSQLANN